MDVTREPAPTEVAAYGIESLLGRGGMGEVYLAEDRRLHRKVALKVIAPALRETGQKVPRALPSGRRARPAIEHPNVIPIYEVGEAENLPLHRHAVRCTATT